MIRRRIARNRDLAVCIRRAYMAAWSMEMVRSKPPLNRAEGGGHDALPLTASTLCPCPRQNAGGRSCRHNSRRMTISIEMRRDE